jgi:hypothetical protein
MKFDNLFNSIFLTEADDYESDIPPVSGDEPIDTSSTEEDEPTVDALPDNHDVEPAPVVSSVGDTDRVKEHLEKIESFIETLNGIEGESLQKLVNDIDRPGSLFQGISRETSSDIIKLAEQTAGLVEILKGFIINSAKRSRDISAGSKEI